MARPSRAGRRRHGKQQSRAGSVLLGILLGLLLAIACVLAYSRFGNPPVAVTDQPTLWEPLLTTIPLKARVRAEQKPAPFPASEEVFESAAHIYQAQCAQCHGIPGHEAVLGHSMMPRALQFFSRRAAPAQTPGELFWKTAFGVRHSGMPAYNHTLTNTQLWQLSLLLHSAGGDLPNPVRVILTAGAPEVQPTAVQP